MASEFELKYRADGDIQARIRADYPGAWREIPMTTTYYDTADGALSANHWTLRHRREGDRDVCTLKTPGIGHVRGEWEWDSPAITQALLPLSRMSGSLELLELASRGLVAVCGARFTRFALDIEGENFAAELALDAGILHSGSREIPLCEVELELKSGDRDAMEAYCAAFAEKYALELEPRSKYARAKALSREG